MPGARCGQDNCTYISSNVPRQNVTLLFVVDHFLCCTVSWRNLQHTVHNVRISGLKWPLDYTCIYATSHHVLFWSQHPSPKEPQQHSRLAITTHNSKPSGRACCAGYSKILRACWRYDRAGWTSLHASTFSSNPEPLRDFEPSGEQWNSLGPHAQKCDAKLFLLACPRWGAGQRTPWGS